MSQSLPVEPEASAWTRYFSEQLDSSDLEGGRRRRRRESDSTPTPGAATITLIAFKTGGGNDPQTPDILGGAPPAAWALSVDVTFTEEVSVGPPLAGSCETGADGCGTPFVLVRNSAGGSNAGCPTNELCNGHPNIPGTRGPYVVPYASKSGAVLTFTRDFPIGSTNYAGLGDILRVTGNIIQLNSGTIRNTGSTVDAILENAPTLCTVEIGSSIPQCTMVGSGNTVVPCTCMGDGNTVFCAGTSGSASQTCTTGNAAVTTGSPAPATDNQCGT